MSCNWCQDEAVARALLRQLCGSDDESWKQESDNDLCYCTHCVREYHRLKSEYIKERPECTKILYKIEEERLKAHFGEFMSQKERLSRSLSESPYDVGDHLKVPSLELLRYPYLLFNSELMNLFVECLGLLIRNGTFDELDEKLPGIYLLLVNPCLEVRKWALKTAKELGTISLEDYHCVSPVINCMLKIVLYSLDDTEEMELQTLAVPMATVDDDANPLPHLFHPLPKKDLWSGLGVIFNALDDDVTRIFMSQQGHCQVFGILKYILESTDADSEASFWPVVFCLKVLMTKLKSTFWLLADFEDAPKAILDLICNHVMYKKELYSLDSRSFQSRHDTNLDEVTLSQLAEKEVDESGSTESNDCKQKPCDPFFWILPYITTVLDLEDLCEKATRDIVQHLYSLVSTGEASWLDSSPTELNYFALNCLCDVIKYLLEHKLIFIIKTVPDLWLSLIFGLCVDSSKEDPSKRWMQLVRKAESILTAMLKQAIEVSADKNLEGYLPLFHLHAPAKGFLNRSVANKSLVELGKILPSVLRTISQTAQPGLFGIGADDNRLLAFSEEDDVKSDNKLEKTSENDCESVNRKSGTSDSPIYIIDSDEEMEEFGNVNCTGGKGIIEPISYEEELDYSEEILSEIEKLKNPEELVCDASQNNSTMGNESAIFRTPQEINSKNEDSRKSLWNSTLKVEVQGYDADFSSENVKAESDSAEVNGCNDKAEIESNDESCFDAITSPETLGAPDVNRHNVLTGGKPQVWLSHDKDEEELLRTDFDMTGSSGRLSDEDECIDDEMITIQSQCKDEDVVEICTSDEVDDIESKEKETEAPRRLEVKDSSISQNVGSIQKLSKNLSGDLAQNEGGKEKLREEKSKSYLANVGKDTSRKRSSASSDRKNQGKRKKMEDMDNYHSLQKERLSAIFESSLRPFDSGKAGDKNREVDNTKSTHHQGLPKQLSRDESVEYDRRRCGVNARRYSSKSPLETKGVFDFIGDLQRTSSENRERDKPLEPREVGMKENFVDEVIAEARGHSEMYAVHDQNEEAKKNMASAAFQRNKNMWYNECVKQQKSRTRSNSNTENAISSVGKSPERTRPADPGQLVKENINVSKKTTVVQKEALPVMTKSKHTRDSLLDYILTWHPAWMENEQHDELSINLPHSPEMVRHKYCSSDDYLNTMWPLILIEFFSQMNRAYKEKERTPFHYKFKSFDTVRESMNYQIIHCQGCQEGNISGNNKEPNKDDLVILKYGDENMIEVFGVIEEIEKTPLSDEEDPKGTFSFILFKAKIRVAKLHPGMSISSMIIEVVTSMVSLYRKWEALIRMPESSLLAKDILAPFRPKVFGLANELDTENILKISVNKYNPGQCHAIAEITKAVLEPYTLAKVRLLQGPPGTGKTHTLTGLVKNILQSKPQTGNFRILVCAASNAAVDEIVFRLKNDPPFLNGNNNNKAEKTGRLLSNPRHNCGDFNILRIGSKSQIDAKVETVSLEYLVKNELERIKRKSSPNTLKSEIHNIMSKMRELDTNCTKLKMSGIDGKSTELKKKLHEREQLQKKYDELQRQMKSSGTKRDLREEDRRLRNVFLAKADIICCTLSGAGNVHMVNTFRNEWNIRNGIPFNCVIIDEAGQCCEPEAMIPLQYGSSKLVLVGDPAQLPATIFSKRALRNGYGQSLFERIQSAFCENKDIDGQVVESLVLMLTDQYRMHPAICEFPSQKFYNGKLSTTREVLERKFHPAIKPMIVLNIKSSLEANEQFGVIHNPEERKYVLHACKEVVKRGISKPEGVGVITPYRKQLQELRREMSDGHLRKVEVHTVDGFQGREKDVIIISCVRTQSRIGFLEDTQRMNVALTRARHSMILIMHADTLQVNPDWKDLIHFARSRQLFFDIASIDEADKAVFVRSVKNLLRTDSGSDTGERNIEIGSPKSCIATATSPQNGEQSSEDSEGKQKESKTLNGKGQLLMEEGWNSADKEDQVNHPLSEKDGLIPQASECGKVSPEKEASRKQFPATNQNGEESSSCEKTKEKKPVYNGALNVKLPHKHSDGTICKNRCHKAETQTRQNAMPLGDINETNGVDKSVKMARRDRPSSSYFIFPHEHGDGTRCVEKCIRMEMREKQRWQKERAMAAKSSNKKMEGKKNYAPQDSATSPREALAANENDLNAKSCSVSKDVISEKDNNREEGPKCNSESSCQSTDRKTVDVEPKTGEEGRESEENLKHHENEDELVRSATEDKNIGSRSTSEIKATDPRLRKKNTAFVENNFEAPAKHSKSPEDLIAPQPRPLRPANKTEVDEREKKKKEHRTIRDEPQEEQKKPRFGKNVSRGQVRAAPDTSVEGYSKTRGRYTSSVKPDFKSRVGSKTNGFSSDKISGSQGKRGNSLAEEKESIHPELRKQISPIRRRNVRIVHSPKNTNGSSPSAMRRGVDGGNGVDSFNDSPGVWMTVDEYSGWRKDRANDERNSRNRVIQREDEYRQRKGREAEFGHWSPFGSRRCNNQQNANKTSFDIYSNNNSGFAAKNNNHLKHSRYSSESTDLSRNSVDMRRTEHSRHTVDMYHTELSRNTVNMRHSELSSSTVNTRRTGDSEQQRGRNLEAVTERIRANKQGRHRKTQLLDSPESIHNGRLQRGNIRRHSYTGWK